MQFRDWLKWYHIDAFIGTYQSLADEFRGKGLCSSSAAQFTDITSYCTISHLISQVQCRLSRCTATVRINSTTLGKAKDFIRKGLDIALRTSSNAIL